MTESTTRWTAVGFDLDGTLFDHKGAATRAASRFTIELGHTPTPDRLESWFALEAEHFENWRAGRMSFVEQRRHRLRGYLHLLGEGVPRENQSLDELFATYAVLYRREWRAYPDAEVVLRDLRSRGVRIGVLTNGNHAQQIDKLEVIGLRSLIDEVCTSERIGVAKPDPAAFEILAERLGHAKGELAFVGDDPRNDIEGARAAGMAAGLVCRTGASRVGLSAALADATASAPVGR